MSGDFDIIIQGGHLIDPKNDIDGPADIAIKDGLVAAVADRIECSSAKVVDVSGLYVTPGLIDIHVHVYGGYGGWLFPDQHALPYGVTTVVDTGGAGWKDMADFKRTIIDPAQTRVLAFVNIVGAGMIGAPEQDVSEMDPALCAEAIEQYREHVVGAKSAHFGGPGWESAGGAIEAARQSDSIAMIDFAPQPHSLVRGIARAHESRGHPHAPLCRPHPSTRRRQKSRRLRAPSPTARHRL